MNFQEFSQTEEGKALQVLIGGALDAAGVNLDEYTDEAEVIENWLIQASDLEPNGEDMIGAGLVVAKPIVEKSKNDFDNKVYSKVQQIYDIFFNEDNSGLDRVLKSLAVVFQSKRKSLK